MSSVWPDLAGEKEGSENFDIERLHFLSNLSGAAFLPGSVEVTATFIVLLLFFLCPPTPPPFPNEAGREAEEKEENRKGKK